MNKIKDLFSRIFKSKGLRYGSNSVVLVIVVLAIVVLVNILIGINPIKLDLTPNKLFSISDTTVKILNNLDKDVYIYGLIDIGKINSNDSLREITEVLGHYGKYNHVKVIYINPDNNPSYLTDIYPSDTERIKGANYVVKSGEKIKTFTTAQLYDTYTKDSIVYKSASKLEQEFTGAIKYVTSNVTHKIYFTAGNGESKLDENFTELKGSLEYNDFEVKTIDLVLSGSVPDDANILALMSPQKDLTFSEMDSIKKYLKNGGNVVFLFDPIDTGLKLPNFQSILADYYLSLNNDKLFETNLQLVYQKDVYSIAAWLISNVINTTEVDGKAIIVPKARSINILKEKNEDIVVTSLVASSGTAEGVQINKADGKNTKGPFNIAVAAVNQGALNPSKILVLGNSQFLSDDSMSKFGTFGKDGEWFFINAMNWMENKKDDVVVSPKKYDVRTLNISNAQVNVAAFLVVVIFPLLIFALGTFVYLRRRHL